VGRFTQSVVVPFATLALWFAPAAVFAQGQPPVTQQAAAHPGHDVPQQAAGMTPEQLNAYAKISVAIGATRDAAQAQLAMARNKKDNLQQALRDKLAVSIDSILKANNMTQAEYEHETFIVSTDKGTRSTFDELVAKITGIPNPAVTNLTTTATASAAPAGAKALAGASGVHIGHVMNAFGDTPRMMGLLPTAMAEAKTAAEHAALAAKDPANLDAMKLHAGHVINAIDPSIVAKGPGLGYGVKKAAQGVVTHIELAAKASGASQNIITHSNHIATSARNTVTRCDQIVALAQKIQAAASAADAAGLVNQLVSMTEQLTAGVDANGDGRITWEAGEGGLQQANEHANLMVKAEGSASR
jgi:hypothetical protein